MDSDALYADGGAASSVAATDVARRFYDAVARGDVAVVRALMHPDLEWRVAEGHPYRPDGTPWRGPDAVLADVFVWLSEAWDGFSLHDIHMTPTTEGVVTQCRYHGTFKTTGRSMNIQVAHVLRIREGLLTHFQQYADTASLQWTVGVSRPDGVTQVEREAK